MRYIKLKTVNSTNKYAKELAKQGAPEWTVVTADTQTDGYGRMGRRFLSPVGSGLYMSIILRPHLEPAKALYITAAAAVALTDAIKELTNTDTCIKWVNDIYLNDKKIAGILTESAFADDKRIEYTVLGIGVNIYTPEGGFPAEISDIASAIYSSPTSSELRDSLAQSVCLHFKNYYDRLEEKQFLDKYRALNIVPNSDITVISSNGSYRAHAVEINDDFKLIIKKEDGTVACLDSGEVSVRRTK